MPLGFQRRVSRIEFPSDGNNDLSFCLPKFLRNAGAFLLLTALLVVLPNPHVQAGTKTTVGRKVEASQRISMDRIDHRGWSSLLRKYVDAKGRVNYRAWKQSSQDQRRLDGYLAHLSQADARLQSRKESKIAFWINAYNALTIKGILKEFPTMSIRNHTARLFGYNIWHDLLLVVGDQTISLHDIEHKVLRKLGEPRIHFAIVCASHSCPRLLNTAYTGPELEKQLTANTRDFFANQENFYYKRGTFYLSSILKWFADDFGGDQAARLRWLAPYLSDRAAQQAAAQGKGRISYLSYDWSLNAQPVRNAR